jgi:hypothetical protein
MRAFFMPGLSESGVFGTFHNAMQALPFGNTWHIKVRFCT